MKETACVDRAAAIPAAGGGGAAGGGRAEVHTGTAAFKCADTDKTTASLTGNAAVAVSATHTSPSRGSAPATESQAPKQMIQW
jgi:hypothetical protein